MIVLIHRVTLATFSFTDIYKGACINYPGFDGHCNYAAQTLSVCCLEIEVDVFIVIEPCQVAGLHEVLC